MTLFEMSVSASLLILAIVVIRSLAFYKLPKITFVILWGVAICRLFLPFSIVSPFNQSAAFEEINRFLPGQISGSISSLPQALTLQSTISSAEKAFAGTSLNPALIVWSIGLIACALFFLVPHFRFQREYKTAIPIDNPFIAGWLRSHKTMRPVQIKQFDRITAPFTYGSLRPVILLPRGMDWADENKLNYVLTHEFIHINRFDTLWKWLLAAGLCIHWFNPLVWLMYVLANRDIEFSCDEAVVRSFGAAPKSSYALALIGMEERRTIQTLLCNNFSRNAIKERIHAIMKVKKVSLIGIAAALFLVIAALIAFVTTGPVRIFQSMPRNGNVLEATPVQQSSANLAGVATVENGNLAAAPVLLHPVDIAGLSGQAKNISAAKSLVISTSPKDQSRASSYSSIVIKFAQDMDVSTLNGDNIIVVDDKHSAVVTYAFNFNYDAETRELHLDMKPEMKPSLKQASPLGIGTGNIVHVFLTSKIKTADGNFIENDYVFSYRT